MTPETIKYVNILKENKNFIHKEFQVESLSIFGSMARGDQRPDSDIDILVDMPAALSLISSLKEFLEMILRRPVDLIRRHSHLSVEFINSVSKNEISIF